MADNLIEITIKPENGADLMPPGSDNNPTGLSSPNQEPDYLSVEKLERWLDEIRNQPRWRLVADKENDYYDGNQIDAETMDLMEERGQAPIIDNQIQPTINAILGMQAKNRVDTKVAPEAGETNSEVAEALSLKMKQMATAARTDRAKSEAYAEQVKVGVSWIEVARNNDPFKCPVRYKHVHRREIYWDWRAKEPNLSDARYLVRRQWYDEDVLLTTFPEQADFIKHALSGRANWDLELTGANLMTRGMDTDVSTGFTTSIEQYEWMNYTRKRLCVYEVWYKTHVKGEVVKLPNGKVIEFKRDDPQHLQAFYAGLLKPRPAIFNRVRVAFWIGPKRVSDSPSPYQHNHFPYVPFFAFRESRTGIPYGLIRAMMSPQDEINARKSKMMWLLSSKRVIATKDAVVDHQQAASEVARPDAYIVINNRPNEVFKVEENGSLAREQFQVMQEAKETIQTAVGVHNSTLGRASGATSGLAINSLVEQDSVTLAEINDNFNMACRQADELMLSLIIEDLSDEENESVVVEDDNGKKREIVLNQKQINPETGERIIINDITKVNVQVVLEDTPSTSTFRNQQLSQLSEVMKSMPPAAIAALLPEFIRATDLTNRKDIAAKVAAAMGVNDEEENPLVQQLQQKVAELEQKLASKHPPELISAQIEKINAEIENIRASAVSNNIKALYEAMQSGQAAVANPAIVPVADQIAKSAGFVDLDGGNLTGQIPQVSPGVPLSQGPNTNPVSPNPMTPPGLPPQQIGSAGPQTMMSPGVGVAAGIEKQGNQV